MDFIFIYRTRSDLRFKFKAVKGRKTEKKFLCLLFHNLFPKTKHLQSGCQKQTQFSYFYTEQIHRKKYSHTQ